MILLLLVPGEVNALTKTLPFSRTSYGTHWGFDYTCNLEHRRKYSSTSVRRCDDASLLLSMSSSSKKAQMQDYTIVPIIGTYAPPSDNDIKTDAIYLSKPNMKIVEIKDKQEAVVGSDGEKHVYERRVAKDVIPVPLMRGLYCIVLYCIVLYCILL